MKLLFRYVVALALALTFSAPAAAETPKATEDVRDEVPVFTFAGSAFGASKWSVGGAGFGGLTTGQIDADPVQALGGGRVWGSPIDRVTLIAEISRRPGKDAAPYGALLVRILGSNAAGWALGASIAYKTDGFAGIEGEAEGSLLFSQRRAGWRLDANVVLGVGTGEEEEGDGELRLRAGYDIARWLHAGVDGQARYRLFGERYLPGGRVADAVAGLHTTFSFSHFFIDLFGGVTTMRARDVGWTARITGGGATF